MVGICAPPARAGPGVSSPTLHRPGAELSLLPVPTASAMPAPAAPPIERGHHRHHDPAPRAAGPGPGGSVRRRPRCRRHAAPRTAAGGGLPAGATRAPRAARRPSTPGSSRPVERPRARRRGRTAPGRRRPAGAARSLRAGGAGRRRRAGRRALRAAVAEQAPTGVVGPVVLTLLVHRSCSCSTGSRSDPSVVPDACQIRERTWPRGAFAPYSQNLHRNSRAQAPEHGRATCSRRVGADGSVVRPA